MVVSKDLQGNLSVEQTDHMVLEGAAGLGAAGFAVGLFAPPLLAATAVGALIVAYPRSAAAKVEPAVTRAINKVTGEAEGHHMQAVKAAIADAQQEMAESGA